MATIFNDIIMPKFLFIVFDMEDEKNKFKVLQNLIDVQKYIIKILKLKIIINNNEYFLIGINM